MVGLTCHQRWRCGETSPRWTAPRVSWWPFNSFLNQDLNKAAIALLEVAVKFWFTRPVRPVKRNESDRFIALLCKL